MYIVNAQDVRRVSSTAGAKDVADELFKEKKYFEAIDFYEQAIEESSRKKSYSLNYNLAECYRRSRYYKDAEALYAKVTRDAFESYPLSLFWRGMMEKQNENYKIAASTFAEFASKYKGKEKIYLDKARIEIEECARNDIDKQNTKYKVEKIKSTVNKEYSTSCPYIFGDTLWFAAAVSNNSYNAKIPMAKGKAKYQEYYFLRIFTSLKESNGKWTEREMFETKIEDKYADVSSPTLSNDGKILFFTVNTIVDGNDMFSIYQLYLNSGKKAKPEALPKPINEEGKSSKDPFITKVGKDNILFFTSDRRGNGGFDIFYSKMDDFGNFTEPKNLGPKINTRTHEHSPFYDPETSTLYYSTRGKNGFGGYDIFKVKGNPKQGWEEPENYGYPVNTGADDYCYVHRLNPDGTYNAFLSSNRKEKESDNTCCDNIYQFDFMAQEDPVLLVLKCSVYDRDNDEMIENVNFDLVRSENDELIEKKNSGNENNTEFSIYKDSAYFVLVHKQDYDTVMLSINITDKRDTLVLEEVFLTKTKKEDVVAYVEPENIETPPSDFEFPIIYYGFNESGLSSSESKKLDKLAKYLNEERTDITISVASHTDNVDTRKSNIKLSKRRTETVIAYLKRKGVSPDRLLGQWYGEDKPKVSNQTESGKDDPVARAKNRRTEFEIITDIASFQKGQMVAYAQELKLSQKSQNESGLMDEATLRKVLEKYGDMSNPDLVFRVQVGAYRNADANLKAKMKVYAKLQEKVEAFLQREEGEGYTKFIIGRVSTLKEANDIKETARKIGIRSSFIVPYYKGKRIRIVDAIEVLAE